MYPREHRASNSEQPETFADYFSSSCFSLEIQFLAYSVYQHVISGSGHIVLPDPFPRAPPPYSGRLRHERTLSTHKTKTPVDRAGISSSMFPF